MKQKDSQQLTKETCQKLLLKLEQNPKFLHNGMANTKPLHNKSSSQSITTKYPLKQITFPTFREKFPELSKKTIKLQGDNIPLKNEKKNLYFQNENNFMKSPFEDKKMEDVSFFQTKRDNMFCKSPLGKKQKTFVDSNNEDSKLNAFSDRSHDVWNESETKMVGLDISNMKDNDEKNLNFLTLYKIRAGKFPKQRENISIGSILLILQNLGVDLRGLPEELLKEKRDFTQKFPKGNEDFKKFLEFLKKYKKIHDSKIKSREISNFIGVHVSKEVSFEKIRKSLETIQALSSKKLRQELLGLSFLKRNKK